VTAGILTPDVHPARMRWHEDLVTAVLAAWLVIDGWAHNTRPRLSTALLFGLLLFLLRRWRPPAGSAAIRSRPAPLTPALGLLRAASPHRPTRHHWE
jgi:hypothetical protein